MAMTYMGIIYFLEFVIVAITLFSMREMISEKINGIRYKKWQEIDTGRRGYTILDKGLNSCSIHGMKKTVNRANIKSNIMYFVSDNVENLKVEDATDKYQFYCNSEEFDTVYKNKLLQTLMLSLQNNYLLIILLLVGLTILIGGYSLYEIEGQKSQLEFIVWRVNQTYVGQ
jgi:hypothetical protein